MSSSIDWASPQWTFVGNLVAMSALFLFDKLVAPPQARWFAIHSFGNLLAVLAAMNATLCTLSDPVESMSNLKYNDSSFFGNATPWPIPIVNAIHIYHMVAFKLSSADFFHHAVFALTMGSTGQLYRLGAFRSFLVFWLSGLPGGIDYFSLVLVKLGKLDGLTQKRNCAAINVWVRGPCLVLSGFIIYLNYRYHGHEEGTGYPPMLVSALIAFLCVFNAQYYTKQSVANHAISHVLGHVKTRFSIITGRPTADWDKLISKNDKKSTLKEPQNTVS
jgi:hypothetical protein